MADNFNINDFRSNISKSYHRTAHFDMVVGTPQGLLNASSDPDNNFRQNILATNRNLHFDIEAVSIPGIALGTDENRRYGIGAFDLKPYTPIFDVIPIVVRSDSEGKIYDFFQSWMKLIVNYDVRDGIDNSSGFGTRGFGGAARGYEVTYKNDYGTAGEIRVYDEGGGEPTIALRLVDCFPIHLGNAQLDWKDNNILKFPVTLTFRSWYQSKDLRSDETQ